MLFYVYAISILVAKVHDVTMKVFPKQNVLIDRTCFYSLEFVLTNDEI